jgi:hypothetical protein
LAGTQISKRWGMAEPNTRNIEALPDPIPATETRAPERGTKNLDALLDSLNGSAERFQTLWFSFLGLTAYLAITALTTTSRMLLLGEPQTLPILNMKVELLPFYVFAPLLFVIFHFYLLMILVLLARTAAQFERELRTFLPMEADQEHYRARVENALFLQLRVGMNDERAGSNSLLLALIALITIVLAPPVTLILLQMMFLPYHSFLITWWHRILVLADLCLLQILWHRYSYYLGIRKSLFLFKQKHRLGIGVAARTDFWLIGVVLWLSFWEGRWAGEPIIGRTDFAATRNGVVFGLFRDRLRLVNEIVVGKDRFEATKNEIASRGGDFVPTRDFHQRDLQGAVLYGADLRGVDLGRAELRSANLAFAELDGASSYWADLQGRCLTGRNYGALTSGARTFVRPTSLARTLRVLT